MTRWKARMRASCPRTRCQDTRYLLANEGLHDIRCRAGVDNLDPIGAALCLEKKAVADALMVCSPAALEAIGRSVAASAGQCERQVEYERKVRLQSAGRKATDLPELLRV